MTTKFKPCPSCPDGNEWASNGPNGRACRTCGGFAVMHLDGSQITKQEFYAACEPDSEDEDALRSELERNMTRGECLDIQRAKDANVD